ncbi:hypothetical protein [Glutamicibacter arilaitensis]|uniref:Uncharacterized protein n=1 Tax=Glutamicibacter arilaitensis TaxID=256701 RepID=A0A4Y8TVD9_9MICC|nr:hypothetical protein [Glutamicibacter arilaitensis]TFH55539.1 hypothetical protein EXY26_00100 [Glutamicibacter arilaitensis]
MGIFASRKSIEQDFARMEQRLARAKPMATDKFNVKAQILTKGMRKNTPEAGLELGIGTVTAWLSAHETLRLLEGTISILEGWPDSPAEIFISAPASASADSDAGAAMAHLPADHLGILHPSSDGELQLLGSLDPLEQKQLHSWLRQFAQG